MNEPQTIAANSDVAEAQAPVATEAVVQQPAETATVVEVAPKGKFDEQLANMEPSLAAPVREQLSWMPESTVYKIVETHGGGYSILYKTYDQSVQARDIRDSLENAAGHKVVPIAKAKLGSEYYTGHGDETSTFSIGNLVEFQATGLIVVMMVIIGLCILCYLMNFVMAKLGLNKVKAPAPKAAAPAPAPAAPAALEPAHCDWDPNAKSVHPGFTNKQLQAFLSIAAVAALEEHPGLTNDELLVVLTAAATQAIGQPCRVTAYKNVNSPAWNIVK
ncbi:MAG: OadG family protein [Fibrobacteraceae bacterium]|nr:OadG family protein [Fibrobacteraceae bacterium]